MGQTWDGGDVAFDPATWAECFRVLSEGGRMLVFGGSRTHHRIWCAIEDAGFVIEDTIMWLYGSGFPKHKSKLKPAFEPICVARKGGTTDLNIDAARITVVDGDYARNASGDRGHDGTRASGEVTSIRAGGGAAHDAGRWPANVVLDDDAAAQLDEQSGTLALAYLRSQLADRRNIRDRLHAVGGQHTIYAAQTTQTLEMYEYMLRLVEADGDVPNVVSHAQPDQLEGVL